MDDSREIVEEPVVTNGGSNHAESMCEQEDKMSSPEESSSSPASSSADEEPEKAEAAETAVTDSESAENQRQDAKKDSSPPAEKISNGSKAFFQPITVDLISDKISPRTKQRSSANENENGGDDDEPADDLNMPGVEDSVSVQWSKTILRGLDDPGFDVWRLDRDGMVDHIEYMYHDLGVARAWKVSRTTLRLFLLGVRERYQDNPYHNFKHCFCVTQMTYSIICKLKLRGRISIDHVGALITAAVCHDVDHPGLNNSYHCHARTPLAILYNYQSILEQHHFAVTCRILSNKESNIFRLVQNRDEVLTNVGELILATDLAVHKDLIETYKRHLNDGFDFDDDDHVMSLMKIVIKCADVSNEVRPHTVAEPWVGRLFAEYSEQSAREKRERLPVTPYMDPELVNVPKSQEGFIRGIMLPMYSELCKVNGEACFHFIEPLRDALLYYELQNRQGEHAI